MRLIAGAAPGLVAGLTLFAIASTARADWLGDISNPFEGALESGDWWLALGLVYVAGLVTSLTPCVYPMIAITVSVFGASQAKSKLHAAGLSSMYVLGICALFTALGLTVGLLQLDSSSLYANAWFWVVIAGILLALSLAMFGVYELRLPYSLQNKLAQMGGIGPKGAFVLGLVGGLIATPCTGPVLGGLLIYIGTSGSVLFGAAALFVFALGLGTLTWLVGTFAVSLPKSGPWMEGVKSVLGLVLVVTALFFLINNAFALGDTLVQKTMVYLVGGVALFILGIGLGAIHIDPHGASKGKLARKIVGLCASASGAVGVVLWLNAAPPLPEGAEIEWMDDYEAARALAEAEGRPLLVDFGASWCGACQELERHTFSDRRVVQEGQRFVPVRIDLSPGEDVARGRELLARYEQRGLPLVVLHHTNGEEAERVTGFIEAEQMVQIMERVD
jgi:thioredoxin:protein disulfide reductase